MSWQTKELWPLSGEPKGHPAKSPSPPLARICGSAGFALAVFASLKGSQFVFGLPPDFLDARNWNFRETIAFGVTVALAIVGGLMGAGAGLYVNVTSAGVNRFLSLVWHFVAEGQVICFAMLSMVLGRMHHMVNMSEATKAFGGTAVACVSVAVVLFVMGQFRQNRQSNSALCIVVSVLFSSVLASYLAKLFRIDDATRFLMGAVYGFVLVVMAGYFIQRDYSQLEEIQKVERRR